VNASVLLVLILLGVVGGTTWTSIRTGHLLHPVFLVSLGFFLPLGAATLRLSDLQVSHWAYETYVLAIEAWLLWLVFPSLWLATAGRHETWQTPEQSDPSQRFSGGLLCVQRRREE